MEWIKEFGEQNQKIREKTFTIKNVCYDSKQQSLRFKIDVRLVNE